MTDVPIANYVRRFTMAWRDEGPALLASAAGHSAVVSASRDPPCRAPETKAPRCTGPPAATETEHQPALAA